MDFQDQRRQCCCWMRSYHARYKSRKLCVPGARAIFAPRDQRALLDTELAAIYCVAPKVLLQAAKRNRKHYPTDCMMQMITKGWTAPGSHFRDLGVSKWQPIGHPDVVPKRCHRSELPQHPRPRLSLIDSILSVAGARYPAGLQLDFGVFMLQ
jgi:hypothetical protein